MGSTLQSAAGAPMIIAVDDEAKLYFQAIEQHFIEKRQRALLLSPDDVRRVAGWHAAGVDVDAVREGIDIHFERMARRGREPRRAVTLAYCEDDVHEAWAGVKQRKLGARSGSGSQEGSRSAGPAGSEGSRGSAGSEPSSGPTLLEEHARMAAALRSSESRALAERDQAAQAAAATHGTQAAPAAALAIAEAVAEAIGKAARKLEGKTELFDEARSGHDPQRTEDHLRRLERRLDADLRAAVGEEALARIVEAVAGELESKRGRMKAEVYERVKEQLVAKRLRERFGLPRLSLFYT